MKSLLLTIITLTILLTTACKKDSDPISQDSSSFSCKIDGTSLSVKGLGAYATNFSDHFTIYGVENLNASSTNLVYLSLPLGSAAGTYALNATDKTGYYIDGSGTAFATPWGASTGSITLDEIDATHAKGTFQFSGFDSDTETIKKTLTEGKFNVIFR